MRWTAHTGNTLHRRPQLARHHGISLLDFMIALAVLALLLSMGVPSSQALLDDNRLRTTSHELISHLNLARHSAVHQSQQVVLCPSADGALCVRDNRWQQGWIVFHDENHNNERDPNETLLRVAAAQPVASITSGNRKYLRFRFDGTAAGSTASLRLCDERGAAHGWRLVISNLGRIRSEGPGIEHCGT